MGRSGRSWTTGVVAGVVLLLAGCNELLDQLDVSEEDREQLEQLEGLVNDVADAAQQGENGQDPDAPDDPRMQDRDGDGEPDYDPDWNPDSFPPPPGEPDESRDYTGQENACDPNQTCGWASYDDNDGSDIRDHYAQEFGDEGTTEQYPETLDENGEPYRATTTTWRDGDTEVSVYTDHHGTDVHVKSAEG